MIAREVSWLQVHAPIVAAQGRRATQTSSHSSLPQVSVVSGPSKPRRSEVPVLSGKGFWLVRTFQDRTTHLGACSMSSHDPRDTSHLRGRSKSRHGEVCPARLPAPLAGEFRRPASSIGDFGMACSARKRCLVPAVSLTDSQRRTSAAAARQKRSFEAEARRHFTPHEAMVATSRLEEPSPNSTLARLQSYSRPVAPPICGSGAEPVFTLSRQESKPCSFNQR